MTTAVSSVIFSPHNYLPGDASRQTRQQIEIVTGGEVGAQAQINNYGKKAGTGLLQYPDVSTYSGAILVGKMDFLQWHG